MDRTSASAVFSDLAPLWESRGGEDLIVRAVRALRAGGAVLDVGCGPGIHLERIRAEADRRRKAIERLVGVDLAEGMARQASERGFPAAQGDAVALPFRDQVFDVVIVRRVLHFTDDVAKVARELMRVIVPGGTIVVELFPPAPGYREQRKLPFDVAQLPRESLLRRYLEVDRRYEVAAFERILKQGRCRLRTYTGPETAGPGRAAFLIRVARASGTLHDELAATLLTEHADDLPPGPASRVLVARLPGPRSGRMPVRVEDLEGWTPARIRALIDDLPKAHGYEVVVKPLRYRTRPHVQAFCEFTDRRITIQVPVPFRPFSEDVPYRAKRIRGKGLRFKWFWKRLDFDRPDELIRYLYLHEYYHWYLRECLGRRSAAETACDRFALQRL